MAVSLHRVAVASCPELVEYFRQHGVTDVDGGQHPQNWGWTTYTIVVNGFPPALVTLDSTSPTVVPVGSDPAKKCLRMTGYTLEFVAQTDPVRIDWVPADASLFSPSCQQEWRRLADQVAAHELTHVEHIGTATQEATQRFRTASKPLTGCGPDDAKATEALTAQLRVLVAAEIKTIDKRIDQLAAALDGEKFTMDCRQCPVAQMKSVTITPKDVVGGSSATVTVTLSKVAPAGGVTVTLESGGPAATVVKQVTVPAGSQRAETTITTTPVYDDAFCFITATVEKDSLARRDQIAVRHPKLKSLVIPPVLTSKQKFTGTVTLNGPAPAPGGFVVVLRDQGPGSYLTTPGSVVVEAGEISETFQGSVGTVPGDRTGQVVARAGGTVIAASATLKP
jgi:hypothetical protein